MRLTIVRNDATSGGFLDVRLEAKQTDVAAVASTTLAGFTADIDYDANHLTFDGAMSSVLSDQGYTLTFKDNDGAQGHFIRTGAAGGNVGTDLGDKGGVDVDAAFGQDFGTIRFVISSAGASAGLTDLSIRPGSAATSFFKNPGNNPEGTVVDVDVTQLGDIGGTALPVELTSFQAQADGTDVLLRWTTSSETNNAGFQVEHRYFEDGFAPTAFVEGHGTTLDPRRYTYRFTGAAAGRHTFRLKQIDYDGAFEYSPEVEVFVELPGVYTLSAAYPNPFRTEARFTLMLAADQQARVEVYDLAGRRVARLHDGALAADRLHRFVFDGRGLPSGLYLYRVSAERFTATESVLLVR